MEYRAYVTARRPSGISLDESLRMLQALDQRHEELGAVGCGGDVDTAVYVLSTDRHDRPAAAVAEMVAAVADAIEHAGIEGAYPALVELEVVEAGSDTAAA